MTEVVNNTAISQALRTADVSKAVAGAANSQTLKNIGNKNSTIKIDDFLKIISTAMSNPSLSGDSSGSSGTDYISQMAQFATMETLNELNKTVTTSMMISQQQQAFSLIGKTVDMVDEKNQPFTGKVERVSFKNGFAQISVNGKYYDMSSLIGVGE
ncbi:flagellar hook capping FlgD N-terminal domain-containing protein [Ligilactobacillus ruminis]|uniref:Flagellar hook capping FlgD N-terminal domain-containing protein n=1 Tax=Ligilactobacillus ruminis TaxID=1623 RepID=A0AAQ2XI80_9LACO|nr:flagellar hook capping FlgD N-terminal domain-containing protein [Ligilactobacillus ruminis]WDC82338.1 flagellar hook capping FlgD N-terminal domain-containing protein [Ligilactobacillus ruminis]